MMINRPGLFMNNPGVSALFRRKSLDTLLISENRYMSPISLTIQTIFPLARKILAGYEN